MARTATFTPLIAMDRELPEPFVRLPASFFPALADGCAELGEPGVAVLHEAGRQAGNRMFDALGVLPETLAPAEFWEAVDRTFRDLSLGSLHFEPLGNGLAAIGWRNLPEATGPDGNPRVSRGCALATGLLGGLLSRAAGRPVPVLEVDCAAGGSDTCWFLIAAEDRLREVHQRMSDGAPLGGVLRR